MRKFIIELECSPANDGAADGSRESAHHAAHDSARSSVCKARLLNGPGFVWLETRRDGGRCHSVFYSEDEQRLAEAARGVGLSVVAVHEVDRVRKPSPANQAA